MYNVFTKAYEKPFTVQAWMCNLIMAQVSLANWNYSKEQKRVRERSFGD